MINNQLLEYIKHQLSVNTSRDLISSNLKTQGWNDDDINEALGALTPVVPTPPVPTPIVSNLMTRPESIPPSVNVTMMAIPENPMSIPTSLMSQPVVNSTVISDIPRHSKIKKIASVIVVLILVCAAGGGAYAYYSGAFISLPGLVSEAMDSARSTTSSTYDFTTTVDFSGISDTSSFDQLFAGSLTSKQLSSTVKGTYNFSDPNNKKSSTDIELNLGTLSLAVELRVLNDTLYIELTKAPTISMIGMFSKYENKWFAVPFKSKTGEVTTNPLSALSGVNSNIYDKLKDDQKEHIYQMSRDAHFVKMVHRFSPETIQGESSYHFSFILDEAGIISYLQLLKEYVNSVGKDDSALSAFDPTSFSKDLNNLKNFNGEIWIGRQDKLLRKIMLNFGIQSDPVKDEQLKVNVVGIFSAWNQPVTIQAPDSSTSFEEFITGITQDSLGTAREKGKDAAVKSSLSNMRAQAELFWDSKNNSYAGVCSSKEFLTMRKSVESSGGTAFTCKEKSTAYAVSTKLPSVGSKYWCIDSTGASSDSEKTISTTSCPKATSEPSPIIRY